MQSNCDPLPTIYIHVSLHRFIEIKITYTEFIFPTYHVTNLIVTSNLAAATF